MSYYTPNMHGVHVVIAGTERQEPLRQALVRAGHRAELCHWQELLEVVDNTCEAVVIAAPGAASLALCQRVKMRFSMPLLPVLVLRRRPPRLPEEPTAPDAWLPARSRPRDVVDRVEELVRIRRAEAELVRLNSTLAELAAENGQLYDRARRDAEATTVLLRELQHRVRNNLASIQALLILERHRTPPRPLPEALDVAISRLRSMAAFQDSLTPTADAVDLGTLAEVVARSAIDVFGLTGRVQYEVRGSATLSAREGGGMAIALNELITNALKHSQAQRVIVEIAQGKHGLTVCVADDGRGMSEEPRTGSGLMIVRAVVRNELNGGFTIVPTEQGTRACVSVPESESRGGTAAGAYPPRGR